MVTHPRCHESSPRCRGKDILWVELFTVLAIALIVGLRLLGVTTDYTVFFLDGMRARVAGGVPRIRAARLATAEFAPIILAAGVIVAAAAASLVVARTERLSAFGPGLALTVLTAMAVSMTLGPALMAIFGGLLFGPVPRWLRRQGVTRREGGGREPGRPRRKWAGRWSLRTRVARLAAARPMAPLEEARRRPVAVAAPQASRAITTAGVALAASFAMLAVIPLEQFRQIAVAMALGVVLDAIAVRSLLVPALAALFGRLGMWPGNVRIRPATAREPAPPPVPGGDQP